MRHAGLQWPPDIWYKDVLQKTPLQLLCKDVLQKTVIEEVALNYQLSTVVSQGMTDSGVIKQFKGGDSHSLVKLSYSSSFYSSSAFSSAFSSFIFSFSSLLFFFLIQASLSPSHVFTSIPAGSFTWCSNSSTPPAPHRSQ